MATRIIAPGGAPSPVRAEVFTLEGVNLALLRDLTQAARELHGVLDCCQHEHAINLLQMAADWLNRVRDEMQTAVPSAQVRDEHYHALTDVLALVAGGAALMGCTNTTPSQGGRETLPPLRTAAVLIEQVRAALSNDGEA